VDDEDLLNSDERDEGTEVEWEEDERTAADSIKNMNEDIGSTTNQPLIFSGMKSENAALSCSSPT